MESEKMMSRAALAKLLETWAARIRSGKPIHVGGSLTELPEKVRVETELEAHKGEAELEIEIKWPIPMLLTKPARKSKKKK